MTYQRLEKDEFITECNRRRTSGLILYTGPTTRYNSSNDIFLREHLGGIYDKYRQGYLFSNWSVWKRACATLYPAFDEESIPPTNSPEPEPEPEESPYESREGSDTLITRNPTCVACRNVMSEVNQSPLPSFCSKFYSTMRPGV